VKLPKGSSTGSLDFAQDDSRAPPRWWRLIDSTARERSANQL